MSNTPQFIMRPDGKVDEVNEEACSLTGIPLESLMGSLFSWHLLPDHKIRYDSELSALISGEENHGRVHCTSIGLDGIGRRLTMRMSRLEDNRILVDLASNLRHNDPRGPRANSLSSEMELLPVARRLTTLCRRASSRRDILLGGLSILAEATDAISGATVEWGDPDGGWPVTAVLGEFEESCLKGVFRGSMISRLTRGDVIVKEPEFETGEPGSSLILVPLMAAQAPEGLVVLGVKGYSVLVPADQQSFGLLGEILGLGLRAFSTSSSGRKDGSRVADDEAAIALGRLSAGLAHEINNAATIIRNNLEKPHPAAAPSGFGRDVAEDSASRDSIDAIETIRDLTDALRAFAPEEVRGFEEVDIRRVLEMVVASVSFYAKRGTEVKVIRPTEELPTVRCRSHHLVRSLFLIFVELWEAASASGRDLEIRVTLVPTGDVVDLLIEVNAGPFSVPAILMSQLERGGVLARHVKRAGAGLSHTLEGSNLSITLGLPIARDEDLDDTSQVTVFRPTRRGKIIVIDDDEAIIRSIRRLLEEEHDVLAASSAHEALKLVGSNMDADVILLDAFMPTLNGPQIREEMRSLGRGVADRVVFFAGGATDPKISSYLSSSSCKVLEKPLDIDKLNRLISRAIR